MRLECANIDGPVIWGPQDQYSNPGTNEAFLRKAKRYIIHQHTPNIQEVSYFIKMPMVSMENCYEIRNEQVSALLTDEAAFRACSANARVAESEPSKSSSRRMAKHLGTGMGEKSFRPKLQGAFYLYK